MIHVGAMTEADMKQKKQRVEDALNATRAAVEEGVVAGGGMALLRASLELENVRAKGDRKFGVEIIERACQAPLRQIAENCGEDGSVVVEEALEAKKRRRRAGTRSTERVGGHVQGRHHRPHQGRAHRAAERRVSISGLMLTTNTLVTSTSRTTPTRSHEATR